MSSSGNSRAEMFSSVTTDVKNVGDHLSQMMAKHPGRNSRFVIRGIGTCL